MRKIIGILIAIFAIGLWIKALPSDIHAASGINNGMSGVFSISLASTPTPAPTITPQPTATPIPTATPLTLPLSSANGGTGVNFSPAPLLKQTKNLGTAGTNGAAVATTYARVTLAAGQIARGWLSWSIDISDGTHHGIDGGQSQLFCTEDSDGTMQASSGTSTNGSTFGGIAASSGFTVSAITASTATGTNTCDFKFATTVSAGTVTSNTLYYDVWWPQGSGTWTAQ